MDYGMWLSAAGMQVNEYRQALVSNNMANVNTTGFKHDLAVIHERQVESRTNPEGFLYRNPLLDNMTGGPWVRPTYHAFVQGPLEKGGSLDVAIEGDGFFTVHDGNEVRYTRDGRMALNDEGELVSVTGEGRIRFLDDSGSPITVDKSKPVEISASGVVEQGGVPVATLGVVDVDDTQKLRKVGMNLFRGDDVRTQSTTSRLCPGFYEGSTVNPVDALTGMIEVSRAYELNARMIQMQDTVNGDAVNRVGRIG